MVAPGAGSWKSYCIGAILLSPLPIDKSIYDGNVVIHSTIRILKQIKLHFNLKSLSPIAPIVGNPCFKPSILDNTFRLWKQVGLCTISNLYWEGVFASFKQLQEIYKLPGRDFLRYLQIPADKRICQEICTGLREFQHFRSRQVSPTFTF